MLSCLVLQPKEFKVIYQNLHFISPEQLENLNVENQPPGIYPDAVGRVRVIPSKQQNKNHLITLKPVLCPEWCAKSKKAVNRLLINCLTFRLPDQGSNPDFSDPESDVLPITPSGKIFAANVKLNLQVAGLF